MRGKSFFIAFTALCVTVLSTGNLYAEDEQSSTHSAYDGYEERLNEAGQQLEDFQPDYNPKGREMYGGYKREGAFKLRRQSGEVLDATAILVKWEEQGNSSTTQYYMVNGNYVKKNLGEVSRELNVYAPQSFVIKKDMNYVYSQPFESNRMEGITVKAGTYTSTRSSIDFVEIELSDGAKVWVNTQYTPMYETEQNGYFLNSKVSLAEKTINNVPVYQLMMPVREDKRTGYAMKASYVTIHNTGTSGVGANALVHAQNQINDRRTNVSWHFTVDDNSIYQSMPMNEVGYHAGDGFSNGNGASIGIEICENADGSYAKGERNAAYLTAHILFENGLPSDAIRMHKDWSGKDCPYNIIHGTKGTMGWANFKQVVKEEYDRLVRENAPTTSTTIPEELKTHLISQGVAFDSGNLSGFEIGSSLTSLKAVIASYDPKSTIIFKDSSGNEVAEETAFATGQRLIMKKEDGTTYNLEIVVFGDVNGDGKIQATDYVKIKNMIMEKGALSGSYLKAADVNHDGNVQATDYVKIKNNIMGKGEINQK